MSKHQNYFQVRQMPFEQYCRSILKSLRLKLSENVFVFCYWFCFLMALIGIVKGCMEFVFWNQVFRIIFLRYRQAMYIRAIILANLLFLYGLVSLNYLFLIPWITIYASHWIGQRDQKRSQEKENQMDSSSVIAFSNFTFLCFQVLLAIADWERK